MSSWIESMYSCSSLTGFVSSKRRWQRPPNSRAIPKLSAIDFGWPMWRYPFGSGGKRVTTSETLPSRTSAATISRMKSLRTGVAGPSALTRLLSVTSKRVVVAAGEKARSERAVDARSGAIGAGGLDQPAHQLDGVVVPEPLLVRQRAPGRKRERVADRSADVLRAATAQAAARDEVVPDCRQVAVEVAEPALDGRHERLVPQEARIHGLRAAVERVQLAEDCTRSPRRVLDRRPRPRVRRRVRRTPVRRAGGEQRVLVRKVAIDGRAANAGARCDRADRRLRGTDLLVQGDGAFRDPPPGLFLELGAALHPVRAFFVGHMCRIILARARRCGIFVRHYCSTKGVSRWRLQSQAQR